MWVMNDLASVWAGSDALRFAPFQENGNHFTFTLVTYVELILLIPDLKMTEVCSQ